METIYPDTEEGVIEFIRKETVFTETNDMVFTPDARENGVWHVKGLQLVGADFVNQCEIIVYMAGHADSFGRVRVFNDFECVKGE